MGGVDLRRSITPHHSTAVIFRDDIRQLIWFLNQDITGHRQLAILTMDVLLRHTILGECIRFVDKSRLTYADERDPVIVKNLTTLEDARSEAAQADESTALLEHGEDHYGSRAVLVDWYGQDDLEARCEELPGKATGSNA